jgi:FG-GAP-like repeat
MKYPPVAPILLVLISSFLMAQPNSVPLIYQPLVPASVAPGHPTFAMEVRGTGFVSGAVVNWNGRALKTRFVSSSILQGLIPAQAVAKPGTASITVANPGTIASNAVYLPVRKASPTVAVKTDPANVKNGVLVVGDFNNDRRPDLAVVGTTSTGTQSVDVYLGGGSGRFNKVPGPQFQVPVLLYGNIVGDVNNDGNMDTTVCSSDGGTAAGCQIFLGDGHGGLTAASNVAGSDALADMNGDGILDMVSTTWDGYFSYVTIQLGNGDGTFQFGSYTQLGPSSTIDAYGALLVGDFNGDGKLDVAIPCMGHTIPGPGAIAVLLGNGDGTVQSEVDYATPWGGTSGAVADVNGDGKLDIITGGYSVMLGSGDGTFQPGFSMELESGDGNVVVGDLNGDGKLDVATIGGDFSGNATLNVLLGNRDGTFQNPIIFPLTHGSSLFMVMADFSNDGMLDFAFGGSGATTVLLQVP